MANEISRVYVSISGTTVALKRSITAAKAMLGGLANVGRALTLPAIAGIGGSAFLLARSLSQAVKESSDLGESISKTRQILGANSAEAEKFAKRMADAGKNTVGGVLEGLTATTMALRNQGIGRAMAEDIARQLEERKIDVASFYNVDPKQIADDLQSAFAGQTDVLRKYFVYLNADQIKSGGLAAAEAISRAFLQGTAVAKGDFERTKNSIANLQRATSILSATAFSTVGASFYGFGQAMEVLKQSIWRFVIQLGESGALTTLGTALQESVIALIAFGQALAEVGLSTGTIGETLSAFGQGIRDIFIGLIVAIQKPMDMLKFMLAELAIRILDVVRYLASFVGQGDILGGTRDQLKAMQEQATKNMAEVVAGIDAKIAERVAELKQNVESPVNPLGAPAMPKPGVLSGGSVSYASALTGAFSRENMQLQEAQKQTKLLEKIAADKPGRVGVGEVVTKPRPTIGNGMFPFTGMAGV